MQDSPSPPGCRVLLSSARSLLHYHFWMLGRTSCSLFLQNSSDPAAVSAAAPLGSTSLEELQQQTQMPAFGDKQPAKQPISIQCTEKRGEKKTQYWESLMNQGEKQDK